MCLACVGVLLCFLDTRRCFGLVDGPANDQPDKWRVKMALFALFFGEGPRRKRCRESLAQPSFSACAVRP